MFSKIMAAVDVERSASTTKVLETAQYLAKSEQAKLHLVSVRSDDTVLTALEFGEHVQKLADEVRERTGLDTGWRAVADDDIDEGLARVVEEFGPDLVVIGAHEPTWVEIFSGPTVRDFVSECEASLLIVR